MDDAGEIEDDIINSTEKLDNSGELIVNLIEHIESINHKNSKL